MRFYRRKKKPSGNQDFETFRSKISWFLNSNSKILFNQSEELRLSKEFKTAFPNLTKLILRSRQTYLTIDQTNYILFAWDTVDGQICGWLNQQESEEEYKYELIEEHRLLLRNIGGIKESFNQSDDSFTNNQNWLFIGSECLKGIGDYDGYYSMKCEEEGKKELEHAGLITFVYEVNGALTLYDPITKRVLLFSHDHSYENIDFMANQPKYTFHTFKKVDSFSDYVEELANQLLRIIR